MTANCFTSEQTRCQLYIMIQVTPPVIRPKSDESVRWWNR